MKALILKSGIGNYEGKEYTYLYVTLEVNGVEVDIKLKPYSALEKTLILNAMAEYEKNE